MGVEAGQRLMRGQVRENEIQDKMMPFGDGSVYERFSKGRITVTYW